MIIVTGGAGFIGSNIVRALNARGYDDVVVVDDLSDGKKFVNIADCQMLDYIDKEEFLQEYVKQGKLEASKVRAIFHQGACSDTTEWDGRFMMDNNYRYSKTLLEYSLKHEIPFIYASSAAVYGGNEVFREELAFEKPLNVYGYSKWLFDQVVRRALQTASSQIVGLRYFNVYGPREQHKGRMASVAFHLHQQLLKGDVIKLFGAHDGYADGEQTRDFVYVDDAVDVNLWFLDHPDVSGIFNAGTGRCQPFNDIAKGVLDWHKRGDLEYVPFPDDLKGVYQSFTQADISKLRDAGYAQPFRTVEQGIQSYLDYLNQS